MKEKFETITVNEKEIKVLQYLPAREKYDLINITMQQTEEDGLFDTILLEVYFYTNAVKMYTDYFIDPKGDIFEIYDELETSGALKEILNAIPREEFKRCLDGLGDMVKQKTEYNSTAASVIKSLINDLPKNAETAAKFVEGFDPKIYENVLSLAKSAGFRQG